LKFSTKEIAVISITAALTVVIGFLFYSLGSVLPIPGNKFLIFAPFLGFMIYIPIDQTRRVGTMSVVSAIFAFIMGFINIFMAIAILLSGLTSDLLTIILFRNYKSEAKKVASAGLFASTSFIWAFIMSYYFTGNRVFLLIGDKRVLIPIVIVTYGLGVIGAFISKDLIKKRIKNNQNNQ
jgi:energy-coupling factor transport system substrate-specific component